LFFNHRSSSVDPQTFSDLFERHKNLVFKTAYLMLENAEEAEDALQEVFLRVYKSLASYDPQKGAFTTWLHRITVNYCLEKGRKRRLTFLPLDESHASLASSDQALPSDRQFIHHAIRCLSEKQRAVIILRYYWDLPYAEIAQILGIPLGTVKSRIDLALKTLRKKLSDQEEGFWNSRNGEECAHEL
jgi:RNA polymerase sigma-70 factor, ECF subfamily